MTVVPLDPNSTASQAVGVDFDLTLADHSAGWMEGRIYGEPIPGALEAVRGLLAVRAVFVVTARHRRHHQGVADWLTRYGFDVIVDTDPDRSHWTERGQLLVTNKKLGGACYIDDRAVHFTGDWTEALAEAHYRLGLRPDPAHS
ncbi:hypothetical protein ACIA8O_38770 [Kitasatospora sp. NPDC051853]|uniref:hypothetical protein n=1 Tax=Kitasatospora sp. NPDC051853 TaxID=3364058 RepID=UPI0037A144D6